MENFSTLDLVKRVRDYQDQNPILKLKKHPTDPKKNTGSHHFVFDLPFGDSTQKPEFLWIGLNPGSDIGDEKKLGINHDEETRYRDWQEEKDNNGNPVRTDGSRERLQFIKEIVGEEIFFKTTQTQLFFWCSNTLDKNTLDKEGDFFRRYGEEFENSVHLAFCTQMNKKLIQRLEPKAIFFESHPKLKILKKFFPIQKINSFDACGRSVDHYILNDNYNLIVLDHLSYINKRPIKNARGSKEDVKREMRSRIHEILDSIH